MLVLNEPVYGFIFDRKEYVEEIQSDVYIGKHIKSGARIMYVASEDENKVFSISFKTVPENDTGVMHILEHSVLNGSDKYPVREPFVELLKSSMQTFLNAMTYPDKTMYPVASCNEKDFENLMDVYLDAVFHPAIYNKKEIFLQEGWHYEGGENECFRGVVYNEMKGEMSSEDSVLTELLQNTIFPDVCYAKNSGGAPEAIPNLTYEEFIKTHKKFYHPENSYIYLYGKMDIEEKLRLIDEGYLNKYDRINADIKIGIQQDKGLLENYGKYDSDEDEKVATHYAMGFKAAEFTDNEKLLAIDILLNIVASNNEAPLKKALLDRGICEDMWAYLDDQLISPYVCVAMKRCDNDDEKIKTAFYEIVSDILKKGIDKELIEANINQTEFKLREAEFGGQPQGLIYCTWVMASWLYGGDPTARLTYEKELKSIREKAKGDYFEKLLEELFLKSTHSAFVKIVPDKNYGELKAEKERERVAAYREKIGEEGLLKAKEEFESLQRMQNAVDSPEALKTIPVLDLKYINPETEDIPMVERCEKDTNILYHPITTKKILYGRMFFDAGNLNIEDLTYAALAVRLIGRLGTDKLTATEVINRIKIELGAFGAGVDIFTPVDNPGKVSAKVRVSFSALEDNIENAVSLVGELINNTDFTNVGEIKKMLLQEKMNLENSMIRSGHSAALVRSMSYFSKEAALSQKLSGVDYYFFIKELCQSFALKTVEKMTTALRKVINKDNLVLSITGDEGIYKKTIENIEKFNLPCGEKSNGYFNIECEVKNEGVIIPTDVAYVAKSANVKMADKKVNGSMFVLSHILTYDYLWNTIRAKGGAYGTGFTVNLSGDMGVYSYRDPNLKATVTAFDKINEYLREFNPDEREMTKYIIGAVAATDKPKSPNTKGARSDSDYFTHITKDMRNSIRRQMLETKVCDIRDMAETLKTLMDKNMVCVFSSKSKIEENGDLFKNKITIK
ncbi:MAG: insulinase family protein [Clostridia bacterium]